MKKTVLFFLVLISAILAYAINIQSPFSGSNLYSWGENTLEKGLPTELDFLILLPAANQDASVTIFDKVGNVVIKSGGIADTNRDLL